MTVTTAPVPFVLLRDAVAPFRDKVALSVVPEVRLRNPGVFLETLSGFVEIPEVSWEFIGDPAREPSP